MAKDIKQLLSDVGLLPSESKVYLAALELGPSTVQNIAKKADISRTAAYEAIELLQKRGLVSSSTVGKRKMFASEDPHRIVSYLKEEQQKFATTLSDIERQVDALHLLAGGIKPTVKVYEGEEALPAYFGHIAQIMPEKFDEVSNLDDVYSFLGQERIKAARSAYDMGGLKEIRLLHFGDLRNPRPNAQYRRLDKRFGEFHGNIAIYEDFVSLVTFIARPVVVLIESKSIADTLRVMYNAAWESCK
jgi:sugar-specific transcriptional regulator TrmB